MKTKKTQNRTKNKKEKDYSDDKNKKVELIVGLSFGIIFCVGSLLFLFIMYRPFVPWVKILCSESDGSYQEMNGNDVKYKYIIDDIEYEKVLENVPYNGKDSDPTDYRLIIYVNLDNPYDVKPGSQGGAFMLTMIIIFLITGIGTICFTCFNYFSKSSNKNKWCKKKHKQKRKIGL